ncbi:insulinase family protein [Patescibacteria group bacterium]|nr:insulinase family protein [Patescibacteria group bacterium]
MLNIKKTTLSNRVRIVTVPMRSTEAVTVMIMARAGSRHETRSINGISHFLEHMFFKGGKRYPDPQSVAEAIDSIGGVFNAFTDNEFVGYYVKVAKEHIGTAFDVLSDMLLNARFDKDGLERERGVILEEYKMLNDDPKLLVGDAFERLMFGDQPLGWSVIGLPAVIKKVKRSDFVNYKNKLYTASNIVVAVAGNTSLAEVTKLTQRHLPFPKSTKKNQPLPYRNGRRNARLNIINKKTEQAHLALGVPTFGSRHRDRYVSKVLSAILGGGMSSRLFTSVRERQGLAYYVYSDDTHYVDIGYLAVHAGVDKERIDLAIKTILEEFTKVAHELVSPKELKKAKDYLIGHFVLSMEDSDAVAMRLGLQELLENPTETLTYIRQQIKSVTAEQVRDLARRIFTQDALTLLVIGPYSGQKKFSDLLKRYKV